MEFVPELGKNIKQLRKRMNISQSELASGICTQALISKIEKGETSPSADLLYQIACKLKVDIKYLFDLSYTPRMDYADEVKEQIRGNIRSKQYDEVMQLIKVEKENPLFNENILNKQFLIWHEGICVYYINKDTAQALSLLNTALQLTMGNSSKQMSEREVEILLSKGIIFSENKHNEESKMAYQEGLRHLERINKIHDIKIKIRIIYNLTKTLIDSKEYKEALSFAEQGIKLCIEEESLYLLGELYYQKGRASKALEDSENLLECMEKAKFIFNITGRSQFEAAVDKIIFEMSFA